MTHSIDVLTKKLEEIKIADDIFFGKDLSFEQKILNAIIEKLGEELKDWEVSFYLNKKSMAICCATLVLTKVDAKKLLVVVDRLLDEHFFQGNGLLQLGWCSHYMLDRRIQLYPKNESAARKTEIVEFYWFSYSPNRFDKQPNLSKVEVCSCVHFYFLKVK